MNKKLQNMIANMKADRYSLKKFEILIPEKIYVSTLENKDFKMI